MIKLTYDLCPVNNSQDNKIKFFQDIEGIKHQRKCHKKFQYFVYNQEYFKAKLDKMQGTELFLGKRKSRTALLYK
jgi:hypothetical protein